MATGDLKVDEGSTSNLPVYTITEDAETKKVPRSALNNSSGVEIGTSSNPIQVTVANTGANSTAIKTDNSAVTQPSNITQLGSTSIDTNSGSKSAGTQRVVLATDQPALTNALKVDGSATTQPISGTVTANAGTNLNTSSLALETGGNLATVVSNTTNIPNTVGTAGSAIPTKLLQVGGSDGTNARAISTTSGGAVKVDISGTSANSTAIKVDNSAVTQPVSGTVSITANSSVNVAQMNGVTTLMGNGTTGTGSQRVTIASDNTPFAIKTDQTTHGTTDLVAADITKVGGTAVDSNSGNKSNGTMRVVLATDQPALTNKLLVTPDANSSVNISQVGGNAISTGVGTTGTGTIRTVVANDVGRTILSKSGSASSSGNNTLVAAGTNKLKVFAFTFSTSSTTAVTCKFQDGASGTDLWSVILQAPTNISTGANLSVNPPAYLFKTSSATLLNLNLSSANAVQWSVSYFDEA